MRTPAPVKKLREGPAIASQFKYRAFISYSHADRKWGDWLHKALETYRIPRSLAGEEARDGPVPKRLYPVFRDREELASSTDLGAMLKGALEESAGLAVICSPAAARSRWVNEEILTYKRLGREDRVLALVVEGEPNASDIPGREDEECFPPALRYKMGPDGELTDERTEPIAADARKGKDGKTNAKLKLVAGLLGVKFDALRQRERRRQRARRILQTAAATVLLAAAGLAVWFNQQAENERLAEQSRGLAAQAQSLIEQDRPHEALPLALSAMPGEGAGGARPFTREAFVALHHAYTSNHLLAELAGSSAAIDDMGASPDGRWLAVLRGEAVEIWDLETYTRSRVLETGLKTDMWVLDDEHIAVKGIYGEPDLEIWSVETGLRTDAHSFTSDLLPVDRPRGMPVDYAVSYDLEQGEGDRSIYHLHVAEVRTGERIGTVQVAGYPATWSVAPDGSGIAVSADGILRLFSLPEGDLEFESGQAPENSLGGRPPAPNIFSPDAGMLAFLWQEEMHLYNRKTGTLQVPGEASRYNIPDFTPDGRWLVSRPVDSNGMPPEAWNTTTGEQVENSGFMGGPSARAEVLARNAYLYGEDRLQLWSPAGETFSWRPVPLSPPAEIIAAIDKNRIATAHDDLVIRIWRRPDAEQDVQEQDASPVARSIASPDGHYRLDVLGPGRARIREGATGRISGLVELDNLEEGDIPDWGWSSYGNHVAVLVRGELFEASALLLFGTDGEPLLDGVFTDATELSAISFMPDGGPVLITPERKVMRYDLATGTGTPLASEDLEVTANGRSQLSVAPDGSRYALAEATTGMLKLFSLPENRLVAEISPLEEYESYSVVKILPGGRVAFSGNRTPLTLWESGTAAQTRLDTPTDISIVIPLPDSRILTSEILGRSDVFSLEDGSRIATLNFSVETDGYAVGPAGRNVIITDSYDDQSVLLDAAGRVEQLACGQESGAAQFSADGELILLYTGSAFCVLDAESRALFFSVADINGDLTTAHFSTADNAVITYSRAGSRVRWPLIRDWRELVSKTVDASRFLAPAADAGNGAEGEVDE